MILKTDNKLDTETRKLIEKFLQEDNDYTLENDLEEALFCLYFEIKDRIYFIYRIAKLENAMMDYKPLEKEYREMYSGTLKEKLINYFKLKKIREF